MSSWDIPCECGGWLKGWPVLLPPIMLFDVPQRMMIFRRISLRSGGLGMTDKEHHGLCVWCCIVELFVVLNDKLFVWVVITKLNYFIVDLFWLCLIFVLVFGMYILFVRESLVLLKLRALHFSALLKLRARCILARLLEPALCAAPNLTMGTPQTTF